MQSVRTSTGLVCWLTFQALCERRTGAYCISRGDTCVLNQRSTTFHLMGSGEREGENDQEKAIFITCLLKPPYFFVDTENHSTSDNWLLFIHARTDFLAHNQTDVLGHLDTTQDHYRRSQAFCRTEGGRALVSGKLKSTVRLNQRLITQAVFPRKGGLSV